MRLFVPFYAQIRRDRIEATRVESLQGLRIVIGSHEYLVDVWRTRLPATPTAGSSTNVYLIESDALYARPSLYTSDPDEHRRFLVLTRAALECCRRMNFRPHIVHSHDWHAAFAPLWLRSSYRQDPLFAATRSVLTIHNIGYQGDFSASDVADLDLGPGRLSTAPGRSQGRHGSTRSSTASCTPMRHHREPHLRARDHHAALRHGHGAGAGGARQRGARHPQWRRLRGMGSAARHSTCRSISDRRTSRRRPSSSAISCCAQNLQPTTGRVPLFGIVSRLTPQKGFDLLLDTLPELLQNHDVRLAVLGSGDAKYQDFFRGLAERHRGHAMFFGGYDESLAHWIEGASDVFLMPSQYEPCGLNQMYSLRYGTIPIVRRTGGLADSVTHFDPATGAGTGIVFNDFDAAAMTWALDTAMQWYPDAALWERIVQNAMRQDFSWETQTNEYLKLFAELLQLDAAALIKGNAPQKSAG